MYIHNIHNNYSTIFKTITDETTGATKSIGIFGKSLSDLKTTIASIKLQGVKSFIFNHSTIDKTAISKYNTEIEKAIANNATMVEKQQIMKFAMNDTNKATAQLIGSTKGAIVTTDALAVAQEQSTLAFKAFSTALKVTSIAGNMITFMAISKAIGMVISAIDSAIHKVEEANEAMDEAVSNYESAKSSLESVNTELDEQNKKLDELLAKDKLTYAEEGQLEELQAITRELLLQQDIEEKRADKASKEAADKTVTAYRKQYGKFGNTEDELKEKLSYDIFPLPENENDILGNVAAYIRSKELLEQAQKDYDDAVAKKEDTTWLAEDRQSYIDAVNDYSQAIDDNISDLQEKRLALEDEYNKAIEKRKSGIDLATSDKEAIETYEKIYDIIKMIYEHTDLNAWKSMQIEDAFNTKGIEKTKEELVEMVRAGTFDESTLQSYPKLSEALEKNEIAASELRKELEALAETEQAKSEEGIKAYASNILSGNEKAVDEYQNQIKAVSGYIDDLRAGSLTQTDVIDIMQEMGIDPGKVDLSTKCFDGLETELTKIADLSFDNLKEAFGDISQYDNPELVSELISLFEKMKDDAVGALFLNPSNFTKKNWNIIPDLEGDEYEALKEAQAQLQELAETGKLTVEAFKETPGYDSILEHFGFDKTEISNMVQLINNLVEETKQLSSFKSGMDNIGSNYASRKENHYLNPEELNTTYEQLGIAEWAEEDIKVWEEYKKVANSTTATIEDFQDAQDKLATSFFNEGNYLAGLTKANKQQYITMLKEMGVKNAVEVVNNRLIVSEKNLAIQKQFAAKTGKQLESATIDEINAFIKEQGYVGSTGKALYQLALKKQLVNNTTLDFSGDIANIARYVQAINGASASLNLLKNIDHMYLSPDELNRLKKQAQKDVDAALNAPITPVYTDINAGNFVSDTGGSSGSDASDSKEEFNWVERKLNKINSAIDLLQSKYENLFKVRNKEDNLDRQIKKLKSLGNILKKARNFYQGKAKKVKLSSKLKTLVRNGKYDISEYDSDTADRINEYEDYISKIRDLDKQLVENRKNILEQRVEKHQVKVDKADANVDKLNAFTDNESSYKKKNSYLEKERKYIKQSYNHQIKIAKLNKDITKQKQLQAEKQKELNDLAKQEFDNIQEYYENRSKINADKKNAIQDQIDLAESKGMEIGSRFYTKQIGLNNSELKRQKNEKKALLKSIPSIKKYSDEWYDAQDALYSVDSSIVQLQKDNVELQKSINQLNFDRFDKLIDKFSAITDEADFLIELLNEEDLFDDNGKITNSGLTVMGLHAESYDVSMVQADKYAEEIEKLNKQLKDGTINQEEFDTQLEKCVSGQRDAIKSAIAYKDAIVSLVEDGLNKEKEALSENIELQKEKLESEKDLHDFQRSLTDKNKTIADLQKQINSLESDDSLENRKKLQQLKAELADANQDRDDFLFDRSISDQENALDDMLKNFEDEMEDYLSDSDKVFTDALVKVNANTENIANSMTETAKDYGYSIQTNITDAWKSAGNAVTEYSNTFMQQSFGVITMIDSITESWNKANAAAEKYARVTVGSVNDTYFNDAIRDAIIPIAGTGAVAGSLMNGVSGGLDLGKKVILTEHYSEALEALNKAMRNVKYDIGTPSIPKTAKNTQPPVYNIDNRITVDGVATNEIVNQMAKVATKQAENVIAKINKASYAKGVRR